jgi:hypothetical protein
MRTRLEKSTLTPRKSRVVFTTEDPQKREISLYNEVWEKHISTQHPEVNVTQDNIKYTIESPNVISESDKFANNYVYSNNSKTKLYINVIVRFTDEEKRIGNVRTAYVSAELPKGRVLWAHKKYST